MNFGKNIKKDLTKGPILKSLLALSVPIILANFLQTAYQLTDTFWLGRLGTHAVAAVSLCFPVIFFIVSLGGGVAIAGTILVSQYKGKKNVEAVNHISTQTILFIGSISFFLAVGGYLLSPMLINFMGASPEIYRDSVSYLQISFIGLIFMFIYMTFQSLMRGVGDVKTPMFIVLSTVLLNLLLDPIFIFGFGFIPAYKVLGAAWASIATQGLAAFTGIFLLLRGKHQIKFLTNDFVPDFKLIKKMLKLGLPASIEQSTRSFGMILMTFIAASFGTITLASFGIGVRILSFIIIPSLGLSMATSTLVGQNIGAGQMERANKIVKMSALSAFVAMNIAGILLFIFAKQIAAGFIPGEEATIRSSVLFIRYMSLTFGFIGIQMALNGAFRGSGNTLISMSLSMISLWVLRFPLAYFLSHFSSLAEKGIWLAFPIANVATAIIAVIWFLQGSWKKKKLIG